MKTKTWAGLGMAALAAVGMLSTSAFGLTVFGNNSQKGSLLIYPRIQVAAGGGIDTLVTLTNDSALPVLVKCYYATSDPLPTPFTGTAASARSFKHFEDFTINLTHNQPVAWWASTGRAYSDSQRFAGFVAPPFGPFPDGQTRLAGELKCWAITDDGATEKNHNHLFGTASIFAAPIHAFEYTAWTFQAIAGTPESALGSPGVLNLDNVEYDACPNILLGNFLAQGTANANVTEVTLASCNQDLRQAFTPTITKLTWTFFNQDEAARTGTHTCADSWFETRFPTASFPFGTIAGLGTEVGYFRIETTADTQICGPDAKTSAYVGIIGQNTGNAANVRGTNLTGRGPAVGKILYDVSPPDSSRPSN